MIKIEINSVKTSYPLNSKNHSAKNMHNTEKVGSTSDYFEVSSDGKEMLKISKKMEGNSYHLDKVMEIHEKGFHKVPTKEESDYYWAARKSNPELDSYLYERDKAEALKLMGQVQSILMKVISGQPLTPEEEKMVKNDPALQQEIQMRKSKTEILK